MTTVQRSLEERVGRFKQSRIACREHLLSYKECMSSHSNQPILQNDHPCMKLNLIKNMCTGQFICPEATREAEQNIDGSHERLRKCQENFLERLKVDSAAYKNRNG